ncbi:MAG: hypothetical protein ABWZ42_10285 [Ilumatobacteraceae bacterium]
MLDSVFESATELVQAVAYEVTPMVVGALDVNGVVERVDIQAIVERIDVERVLDRIDIQDVLERVDLNALLEDVDLNLLMERLDLDRLLERVDIDAIVERTDLGSIVSRSGSAVMIRAIDGMRAQGIGVDSVLHGWIDRLLRRNATERRAVTPRPGPNVEQSG